MPVFLFDSQPWRLAILHSDPPLPPPPPCLQPTPYHECDRQGLAHAYASPVPFIKDGLLFHFKAAHYQLGPTPLVLLWKDGSVARYLGTESIQVSPFVQFVLVCLV